MSVLAKGGSFTFAAFEEDMGAFLKSARIAYRADGEDHGDALANTLALLRNAAIVVTEAPLLPEFDVPSDLDDGQWAFCGDHYCAAERLVPNFWDMHSGDLSDYAYPIYKAGRDAKAWQYRKVLDLSESYRCRMTDWFEGVDFLLMPGCSEAPLQPDSISECGLGPRYPGISIWNIAGNPVAALPVGTGKEGMPVSVQIIGRHGEDARVLRLAEYIQSLADSPIRPSVGHINSRSIT